MIWHFYFLGGRGGGGGFNRNFDQGPPESVVGKDSLELLNDSNLVMKVHELFYVAAHYSGIIVMA